MTAFCLASTSRFSSAASRSHISANSRHRATFPWCRDRVMSTWNLHPRHGSQSHLSAWQATVSNFRPRRGRVQTRNSPEGSLNGSNPNSTSDGSISPRRTPKTSRVFIAPPVPTVLFASRRLTKRTDVATRKLRPLERPRAERCVGVRHGLRFDFLHHVPVHVHSERVLEQ